MAVVPGVCGIALFSPRLNEHGNTVRGIEACTELSSALHLHVLNKKEGKSGSTMSGTGSRVSMMGGGNKTLSVMGAGGKIAASEISSSTKPSSARIAWDDSPRNMANDGNV